MSSAWQNKRLHVIAILALVVVSCAAVALYFAERPWYRGRPASFWFDGLNQRYRPLTPKSTGKNALPQTSSWGSPTTWVNLEAPPLLKEFEPFRRMGSDAVPFLVRRLEHPNLEQDTRAALRNWLPQKLKFLAPWPKPPSEQQLLALWILGEIGPAARGACSNILNFIDVAGLDYAAIEALRKIGVDAKTTMPALCQSLVKHSAEDTQAAQKQYFSPHGRRALLLLLQSLGTEARSAAPILIDEQERCLDRIRAISKRVSSSDRDWEAGCIPVEKANLLYTSEALCQVSPQDNEKAVPYLAKILRDEEFFTEHIRLGLQEVKSSKNRIMVHPGARARAAKYLSEIGSREAILVLKDFLKDDDQDVAAAAREAVPRKN